MSRMDSKRWIPVSQIFIYTEEDPVTIQHMGYTQNIYNRNRNNIHQQIYTQSNTRLTLSLRKYISLMFSYLDLN